MPRRKGARGERGGALAPTPVVPSPAALIDASRDTSGLVAEAASQGTSGGAGGAGRSASGLLDGLIYTIHDVLSADECDALIRWAEAAGFERAVQRETRYAAHRDNGRLQRDDPDMAAALWARLRPHVPEGALGLSRNMRWYRYGAGQAFGPHVDESVPEPGGGESAFTALFYLNGGYGGGPELDGGETVFYADAEPASAGTMRKPKQKAKSKQKAKKRGEAGGGAGGALERPERRVAFAFAPERGAVLLHGHGARCLLHEGAPVRSGVKYLMRTDVVYP